MHEPSPRTLCRVTTADGLYLDGSLGGASPTETDTAFLLVHGTLSNFYAPGALERLAASADAGGFASLRVNTRGHDGMCSIAGTNGTVRGGATNETVGDCTLDLAAWIEFLIARGYSRVVLTGHSMGGVKAVFSQAFAGHAAVAGIVCLSPPRFSHEHWINHPNADPFRATFDQAVQLVLERRNDELLACRQPLPFVVTANAFVEKYGPDDRYDIVTLLPQVSCPVLITVGSSTINASPAFDSLPNEIQALTDQQRDVRLEIISGEDMSYSRDPDGLFELIRGWLPQK